MALPALPSIRGARERRAAASRPDDPEPVQAGGLPAADFERERELVLENDPPALRRVLTQAYAPLGVAVAPAVVGPHVTAAVLLPPATATTPPAGDAPDGLVDELAGIALSVARATCAAAPAVEAVGVLLARDPGGTALPRPLLYGSVGRELALRDPAPSIDRVLTALLEEGAIFRRAAATRELLPVDLPQHADMRAALAVAALRPH